MCTEGTHSFINLIKSVCFSHTHNLLHRPVYWQTELLFAFVGSCVSVFEQLVFTAPKFSYVEFCGFNWCIATASTKDLNNPANINSSIQLNAFSGRPRHWNWPEGLLFLCPFGWKLSAFSPVFLSFAFLYTVVWSWPSSPSEIHRSGKLIMVFEYSVHSLMSLLFFSKSWYINNSSSELV